jgi:hypothetical protein
MEREKERTMRTNGRLRTATLALAIGMVFASASTGRAEETTPPKGLADVSAAGGRIEWTLLVATDGSVLTVRGPGGGVERYEVPAGDRPVYLATDAEGKLRPDGTYVWELRPVHKGRPAPQTTAPGKGEDPDGRSAAEAARATVGRGEILSQSGSFLLRGGTIVSGGSEEEAQGAPNRAAAPGGASLRAEAGVEVLDQVFADDMIVQGSLCVGFDCVNNENFGFDTIRLKENNTADQVRGHEQRWTFPTTDWQLTANDSASGGQNKFSIEDITGARVPFTVGPSDDELPLHRQHRAGRVPHGDAGARPSYVNTSNTPGWRLEQNSSGGFTAQTWDIARQRSELLHPRRHRRLAAAVPDPARAPRRAAIDISASGNVGIGTASPSALLHVSKNVDGRTFGRIENSTDGAEAGALILARSDLAEIRFGAWATSRALTRFGRSLGGWTEVLGASGTGLAIGTLSAAPLVLGTNSVSRMELSATTGAITTSTGASLSAGGVWTNASSRELKQDILELSSEEARETLEGMTPVRYAYRADPAEKHVGFIAEDVPDLVATQDRKGLSPMDMVAVLTRVVQEQQETIEKLSARLARLEDRKD